MKDVKIQEIFRHLLDLHDSRVAKLKNLFTIQAYQVVVLFKFIRAFELRQIFSELMLYHQITIQQQLYRIV